MTDDMPNYMDELHDEPTFNEEAESQFPEAWGGGENGPDDETTANYIRLMREPAEVYAKAWANKLDNVEHPSDIGVYGYFFSYTQFVASMLSNNTVNSGLDAIRTNAALGLAGESGEVADLVKKLHYHNYLAADDPEFVAKMQKELGDVMWYWTLTCLAFGLTPTGVISANVKKLKARHGGTKFDASEANRRYSVPQEE